MIQALRNHYLQFILAAFLCLALVAVPTAVQGGDGESDTAKINLNQASVDDLVNLPGIGPAYAKRIVEYREKHGPFQRVEDLLNVRGIGDRTLDKLRDRVTIKNKR